MRGKRLVVIGLLVAALAGLAVAGGTAAAQEELENDTTVPGVDAGEERTVDVAIDWNDSATDSDSVDVSIDHVLSDDTVNDTTTETVDADPGNTTTTEIVLTPTVDVDHFEVSLDATDDTVVDDVEITDDSGGGSGGLLPGGGSGSAVGGLAVIALLGGVGYFWRDRR